jgi:O-methyltransferase involved in polyketide biosynthesis
VKPGKPSYTAEGAAAIRALETLTPGPRRVFEDAYAIALLSTARRIRMLPGIRHVIARLVERNLRVMAHAGRAAGSTPSDRHRTGDRADRARGAGYDTTFLRHPDSTGRPASR